MALTAEQQAELQLEIDKQNFRLQSDIAAQEAREAGRRAHEIAMEQRRARLEAVRLAKETLIENARSKPVDARDVSASDVTTFANALNQYIDQ
jgi:hypothetical protein